MGRGGMANSGSVRRAFGLRPCRRSLHEDQVGSYRPRWGSHQRFRHSTRTGTSVSTFACLKMEFIHKWIVIKVKLCLNVLTFMNKTQTFVMLHGSISSPKTNRKIPTNFGTDARYIFFYLTSIQSILNRNIVWKRRRWLTMSNANYVYTHPTHEFPVHV